MTSIITIVARLKATFNAGEQAIERSLHTVAGEVNLKVPKLRRQTFETAIIERYRRRESRSRKRWYDYGDDVQGLQLQ